MSKEIEQQETSIAEIAMVKTIREMRMGGDPFLAIYSTGMDDIVNKYKQIFNLRGREDKETIKAMATELEERHSSLMEAINKTTIYRDKLYQNSYEGLKSSKHPNWSDLFTEIYPDADYLNEIFVRLVEEQEGIKVTSAKQLQDITGIREIYGYWDEEKGETVSYGDKKPTKKEAQEEAFRQIEDTFLRAMKYRYNMALEALLEAGLKYKDLLLLDPVDFNLQASYKEEGIKMAIALNFDLIESLLVRADVGSIADEIEAPYAVVLSASKLLR